ncbi:MAG: xylulokinase [Lachnospiraceae bacterium]
MDVKHMIEQGQTALGIEFGSTRIKAQLAAPDGTPLAAGAHEWENALVDGIWTYSMEDITMGMQSCYQDLVRDVKERYDIILTRIGAIGISAMMHGYMAFDEPGTLLVPFRTWRNSITGEAAEKLTELFQFNIPERWSIAHLYQAILNQEEHVNDISFLTTLAGYIHWQLTGEKVLGIGDASGMFPIDSECMNYNEVMAGQFDSCGEVADCPWKLQDILPKVLTAGTAAGRLTQAGAKLLDTGGNLQAGIPFCPPEGDAGTGMAATNSVAKRTGNVSAGTSVFAMLVLEQSMKGLHREIDMVTTPSGHPVAMVHANNCTSDLNAWVGLFGEFARLFEVDIDMNDLYGRLYRNAMTGDADCGGLMSYGYFSGEYITGCEEGRPLFVRMPDAGFTLANFMRSHLYSAVGALKIGMDILTREEGVQVDTLQGHGGFFKTPEVGQRVMAAAMETPVSVMKTAGEGGPWGMALLALYMMNRNGDETLEHYLEETVFAGQTGTKMEPGPEDVAGFETFMAQYRTGIAIEQAAIKAFKA